VPANVLKKMKIIFVQHVDEVMSVALLPKEEKQPVLEMGVPMSSPFVEKAMERPSLPC